MNKLLITVISFFIFGCAIVVGPKDVGNGELMLVTGCAYGQEAGKECLDNLRTKAVEDCEKKKLKYSEVRTDIIPGAKVVYKCL